MTNPTDFSQVMEAVNTLRTEIESKKADIGKIGRLEDFLNAQEAKNQELVNAKAAQDNLISEMKGKLEALEKIASRPANTDAKTEVQAERKALDKFLRVGPKDMSPDELKYLRTDKDSDGGYTTQPEFVRDVIKQITEISPMRQISTVRTIGRGRLNRPVRTALPTVTREGEGLGAAADTNSTYGLESVPVYRYTAYMDITLEALSDPDVDLLAEATSDFNEAFAQAEGFDFVKGNGVKRAEGFMTNASVGQVVSGVADQVTIDSLITMTGEIKTGYAPNFVMNRKTVANLRTKKGGDGQYIWNAGNIAAGIPNTLAGYGYVEVPDMDDIAANAFPIAFGDFRRAYMIVDRLSIGFLRDDYTQATQGKVRFVVMKRTGGQVILPEAIKKLKVAVS